MLRTTPQERQALGVTALLLVAGAGVRIFTTPAGPVEVAAAASAVGAAVSVDSVRGEAQAELSREQVRSRPLAQGEKIDLNQADELEIDRLPRVGPALARKIVEWRAAHGPFRSLGDLDAVPGVGAGLLEAIAPHLDLPRKVVAQPLLVAPAAGGLVNLNTASPQELQGLPGIGPALAGRIVAARPFQSVEQLDSVAGIGPALMERLRPLVTAPHP